MVATVKKEAPALLLDASSYDGREEDVAVSYDNLRNAKVGDTWKNHSRDNCGRDVTEEIAEVVYKTDKGVAVLIRVEGTTDSLSPKPWKPEPLLMWFEFAEGVKK